MMSLKNFTVLYVEDSKTSRELLKNMLEDEVKELYLANDGIEGIEIYAHHKPDVIISDINMPEIDGLKMSSIIKRSRPEQKIILLTEFENVDNLKDAINIGVNSFVAKPLNKEKLLEVLEKNVQELQNRKDANKLKQNKLLIDFIHEIGHHWKQPLTTILALSSGYEMKNKMNLYSSEEERFQDINTISENIEVLSNMFKNLEEMDLENISLEDMRSFIQVSDPIYQQQ